MDALVLPSTTETLGLVLLEAMAAGSVVIGAKAGGILDVVRDEHNGFLFDPSKDGDLVRAAKRVVDEPDLCRDIRARAREQAEGWNWEASTRELVGLYKAAIRMPRMTKSKRANSLWMLTMKRAAIGGMKIFLS